MPQNRNPSMKECLHAGVERLHEATSDKIYEVSSLRNMYS